MTVRTDTDAARKAVAIGYLKALDAGGVSPTTGLGLFDHFTDDAEVYFPKWGVARGKETRSSACSPTWAAR